MEKRWQFDVIGGRESRDDWEDMIDDFDEDEWEQLSHYHPDRFDRRAINRMLAKLAPGPQPSGAIHESHPPAPN